VATSALALSAANAASCQAAESGSPDAWLARDKALHYTTTALLAGDGYAATSLFSKRVDLRLAGAIGLASAAGVAKEVYDGYGGGDASWRDLTWDLAGATTGAVIAWLVDRYLF
jgi:putative lipoprotein